MNDNWTSDYPTVVGNYWFYGWRTVRSRDHWKQEPKMLWVRVRRGSNCLIYYTEAEFLKASGMLGVWKVMVLPELPDDFDERFGNE